MGSNSYHSYFDNIFANSYHKSTYSTIDPTKYIFGNFPKMSDHLPVFALLEYNNVVKPESDNIFCIDRDNYCYPSDINIRIKEAWENKEDLEFDIYIKGIKEHHHIQFNNDIKDGEFYLYKK
jgi:hypothetical protein